MNKSKENHLGFGHLMIWKSSEISAAWVNLIVLSYLTIYASDILGLKVGLLGTILLISKLVDAVTDVLAGWLVDNTNTKIGRGRPYEICILGQTICTVLLFCGNESWSKGVKVAWVICMYTLVYSIFGTLRNAGQNVYTIRHFKTKELIEKQAAFGGVVVMFFSIAVSVVFPIAMGILATSAAGWRNLILIFMIPATLIGVMRFIFCKEDTSIAVENSDEKVTIKDIFLLFKSNGYMWIYAFVMLAYNLITNLSVGSYYYTYVLGDISLAGLMGAISVIILPILMFFPKMIEKIGSLGKMIFYMSWLSVAGYLICWFSNNFVPGVFAGMLLGTLGTMPVMYFGTVFIMDICTYNEMNGLPRMESCSGILTNFASKVGSAMGSWITGLLLTIGGYISSTGDQTVVQPDSAITMIRVDFCFVPLVFTILIGFGCFLFSRLEKKTKEYLSSKA